MKTKPLTDCGRFTGLDLTFATQLTADYEYSVSHLQACDIQFSSGGQERNLFFHRITNFEIL
jgi:hypothetical protein